MSICFWTCVRCRVRAPILNSTPIPCPKLWVPPVSDIGTSRRSADCAADGRKQAPPRTRLWRNDGFRNYADYALTPGFREGLGALRTLAGEHTCAIMSAETLWWRCHRRIITDYVVAAGDDVVHILGPGRTEPGRLTLGAELQPDGALYYPNALGTLL